MFIDFSFSLSRFLNILFQGAKAVWGDPLKEGRGSGETERIGHYWVSVILLLYWMHRLLLLMIYSCCGICDCMYAFLTYTNSSDFFQV